MDRSILARWMPWTSSTNAVEDEINFIKYAKKQNELKNMFMLTILVNKIPVGSIDLHNVDIANKHAEIGYWLSSKYQGNGIISKALNYIIHYAFDELHLHKLILQVEDENKKSIAVAKRNQFKLEATLKDYVNYNNTYKDILVYVLFDDYLNSKISE